MPKIRFSTSPGVLIEEARTPFTFRFQLDEAPPARGVTATVTGSVPQSLTQLDLFAISTTGGKQPVGDFDFSGFDFTITGRTGTIRAPIFADGEAEGVQTVIYTLQPRAGYKIDPIASSVVQFADRRADILTGKNSSDRLVGGKNDDRLVGSGGNDVLNGRAGNDVLIGGVGSDVLTGSRGVDVFGIQKGAGTDTITDFKNNQDRIGVARNIAFQQLDIVQQGRNTLLQIAGDELAVLPGVRANQITAADFARV